MKLPKDFEAYFRNWWRPEDVEAMLRGLSAEPTVSIRINPKRIVPHAEPEGADGHVPWCDEGRYLKARPAFTADPLLHTGAYYVQEASSMFLAHLVRSFVTADVRYALDLCAAPGGKSTLLRSLLPEECLLVSNEPLHARAQVLAENIAKWAGGETGGAHTLVTRAYAADITQALRGKHFFDVVLADVPCSGEGMMRKEEEAVRQWSHAFVSRCAALQRSIIEDIWPALSPGGLLIYSTCTFNPEEDEENVDWIARELGADLLPIPTDASWGIRGDLRAAAATGKVDALPVAHFLPGEIRGEGFFCAALRKHGNKDGESEGRKAGKEKKGKKNKEPQSLRESISSALTVLPTDLLDEPSVPRVELTAEEAISYLQRESLVLPPSAPRGHVQVCYQGQRLGLVNNLGSRANNLYPKEWRIRSGHISPHCLFEAPDLANS